MKQGSKGKVIINFQVCLVLLLGAVTYLSWLCLVHCPALVEEADLC